MIAESSLLPTVIGTATLYLGKCLETMRLMPTASVDSIVTDPPYELTGSRPGGRSAATEGKVMKGFMGMEWDGTGIAYSVEMWTEAMRVLKPGGHLLAFGGSRTYHRMACAIEDAGFEIRDQIMWIYGSGFPKSRNGEWGGTALKPAHEPICMARKPLMGTVAANWSAHGTGALNINACRVGWPGGVAPEIGTPGWGGPAKMLSAVPGQTGVTVERSAPSGLGRWPANVIHDGSDEVLDAFPNAPGQQADAKIDAGERITKGVFGSMKRGREASAHSDNTGAVGFKMKPGARRMDIGSAARFFYCAKASRADRNAGCEGLPQAIGGMVSNTSGQHITRRDEAYQAKPVGNHHPTVKPTDLMAYLCCLVTPPGGTVLDPFMGSGSTGKACARLGFRFIGIDMNPDYVAIARARVIHEQGEIAAIKSDLPDPQIPLFSDSNRVAEKSSEKRYSILGGIEK